MSKHVEEVTMKLPDNVAISMLPLERNKVQVRLTNLDDEKTHTIDTCKSFHSIVTNAHPQLDLDKKKIDVHEMSLTGNMPLDEMLKRKIKWTH